MQCTSELPRTLHCPCNTCLSVSSSMRCFDQAAYVSDPVLPLQVPIERVRTIIAAHPVWKGFFPPGEQPARAQGCAKAWAHGGQLHAPNHRIQLEVPLVRPW